LRALDISLTKAVQTGRIHFRKYCRICTVLFSGALLNLFREQRKIGKFCSSFDLRMTGQNLYYRRRTCSRHADKENRGWVAAPRPGMDGEATESSLPMRSGKDHQLRLSERVRGRCRNSPQAHPVETWTTDGDTCSLIPELFNSSGPPKSTPAHNNSPGTSG
jgi:hypothetical protein